MSDKISRAINERLHELVQGAQSCVDAAQSRLDVWLDEVRTDPGKAETVLQALVDEARFDGKLDAGEQWLLDASERALCGTKASPTWHEQATEILRPVEVAKRNNNLFVRGQELTPNNVGLKILDIEAAVVGDDDTKLAKRKLTTVVNKIVAEVSRSKHKGKTLQQKVQTAYAALFSTCAPYQSQRLLAVGLKGNAEGLCLLDCDTSCFAVLAAAHELALIDPDAGWDKIELVEVPGHVFLRVLGVNISFGEVRSDSSYIQKYALPADFFETLLPSNPIVMAYQNVGRALRDRGAHERDARSEAAHASFDEAIGTYVRALRINRRDARTLVGLGNALMDRSSLKSSHGHRDEARADVGKAIDAYEEALDGDAKNVFALEGLGDAFVKHGRLERDNKRSQAARADFAKALDAYEQALYLEPKDSSALARCGDVFAERGLLDRADDRSFAARDDFAKAIAFYERALDGDPKNEYAARRLGDAFVEHGRLERDNHRLSAARADFAKAIEAYESVLYLNSQNVRAQINLGDAFVERGRLERDNDRLSAARADFDKAVGAYEKALRINPKSADAFAVLGITLHERGLLEQMHERSDLAHAYFVKAVAAYEKALRLDPKNHGMRDNLRRAKVLAEQI